MRRIDAHQHYWRLRRADYGWLTTREGLLYRDFMPEDLAATLEECAIDQTLLVQAAATEAETRFLLDLARQHPSVAGVIGWVDFEASDVSERIRSLIRQGGGQLKGLRPMIQDIADPDWLGRKALDSLVNRFFGGSCELLVVNLLKEETIGRAELRRIKKMIAANE